MTTFTIPSTKSSPLINFCDETGVLLIQGKSFPENAFEFYRGVLDWVRQYLSQRRELYVHFNVSYMNSSSTACTLDLLDLLEDAYLEGARVGITWRYDRDRPRSLDLAQEFRQELTIPFSILASA